MPGDSNTRKLEEEFPLLEDIIYLNHAAVSPWPAITAAAIKKFTDENLTVGASYYPVWLKTENSLRKLLAQLINATSAEDIALLKNTSEALSVVAYGIDWRQGDEIVITDQEFPSNRIVWESLKNQGVKVMIAKISDTESPEGSVIDAITSKTRLVSVSSVQYASGLRLNLETIGKECQRKAILFCVDAIQSLGAFEFDVEKYHADFVMADGHKWLMSPEGLALFYSSAKAREKLKLNQYGWHMVEEINEPATAWQPARSARRFECGSPNMLGIHAMHASMQLINRIGIDNIQKHVLDNTRCMIDFIHNSKNLSLVYHYSPSHYSGIVSFKHEHIDNVELFDYLTNNKVICMIRGKGIRFSPHFYTPRDKILNALQLADEYAAS